MTIAIVDDIAEERILLRTRLENILDQKNVEFHCYEYENGEAFLKASKEHDFTVLFLDIYMNGANGIEIAREFRNTNKDCLLIFTTTSLDHALEGFKVRAMHYLVKPFTAEDIDTLTDELLTRIGHTDKYMELKAEGSLLHLRYQDIIYAEHFAHIIYVHTTVSKVLATRQTFKAFTAPLTTDPRFFICSRGVIVNMEHAADFEGSSFCMKDGSHIFVSQELLKNARQAFMEYLLQRGCIS